jgi:hypothetical protein
VPGANGGVPLTQTQSGMSAHITHSHSPVKESRLQRETSADDVDGEEETEEVETK